ncbi:hypothetical protein CCACVL1_16272 [Corchorus capsularis]|uniref:ZF-HD dimerization-type domain-containing protein n=1 Tax=Corchorus capsularis TaxID=210143 RepID=A0A1R3HY56_COCAP|nr:hypothetical protein CCACVL1_16272 [Corchorus capsularis]
MADHNNYQNNNGAAGNLRRRFINRRDQERVEYRECRRNMSISTGRYIVDGCAEFIQRRGVNADPLQCAACGCHRSFHRRVLSAENQLRRAAARFLFYNDVRPVPHQPQLPQPLRPLMPQPAQMPPAPAYRRLPLPPQQIQIRLPHEIYHACPMGPQPLQVIRQPAPPPAPPLRRNYVQIPRRVLANLPRQPNQLPQQPQPESESEEEEDDDDGEDDEEEETEEDYDVTDKTGDSEIFDSEIELEPGDLEGMGDDVGEVNSGSSSGGNDNKED